MKYEDIYDILIQFFNFNVNFNIIFDFVEQPYQKEILNYIEYIKTKPSKENLANYYISEKSKTIILEYINYILKKTKNQ